MYSKNKHRAIQVIIFAFTFLFAIENLSAKSEEPYKNAIKITFLSWASGSTKISYERAFPRVKQSGEL